MSGVSRPAEVIREVCSGDRAGLWRDFAGVLTVADLDRYAAEAQAMAERAAARPSSWLGTGLVELASMARSSSQAGLASFRGIR